MKKFRFVLILGMLLFVAGFQSCTQENQALKAPKIPDTKMLAMDFNGFDTVDPDHRSFSNWFHAAVNVYFWTRTVVEVLKVPVVALVGALHQHPIYQGEDTWLWSYSITVPEGEYHIELYGTLTDMNEIQWRMYVSKTGDFSDFLWFSGATAYDESYSNWMLNTFSQDPADPFNEMEFIKIEYQKDLGNETEQIRYTNSIPGHDGNGGYIQYGTQTVDDYPVFYDIYKIEEDNFTLIQFNPETKNGRVNDQKRFHNDEWHCWDENTNDIDCP